MAIHTRTDENTRALNQRNTTKHDIWLCATKLQLFSLEFVIYELSLRHRYYRYSVSHRIVLYNRIDWLAEIELNYTWILDTHTHTLLHTLLRVAERIYLASPVRPRLRTTPI